MAIATLALLLLSRPALAAEPAPSPCVVVWLDAAAPAPELTRRTQSRTQGACEHRAWSAIAGVPGTFGGDDEARLSAVRTAINVANTRWPEFDVEPELAGNLVAAVQAVTVVRDAEDRALLQSALYLAGSAVHSYFPGARFGASVEASPYRRALEGQPRIAPWLDALALGGSAPTRASVRDGVALKGVQALNAELSRIAPGQLTTGPLPPGVSLVVDGNPVPSGPPLPLTPGRHYVHLLDQGVILGRARIEASPGVTLPVPLLVDAAELATARAAVLSGGAPPADVATAMAAMNVPPGARLYLATLDDAGSPRVMAQGGGAVVASSKPVNLIVSLGGAAGLVRSAGLRDSVGTLTNTIGVGPDLRLELGLSNAAIFAGARMTHLPGQAVRYLPLSAPPDGQATASDNQVTNSLFGAYGGLGVYLPKPTPGKGLFLLGAEFGYLAPGALGAGGVFSAGIPVRDDGLWLRIGADVWSGKLRPGFDGAGTRTLVAGLEIGVARLF